MDNINKVRNSITRNTYNRILPINKQLKCEIIEFYKEKTNSNSRNINSTANHNSRLKGNSVSGLFNKSSIQLNYKIKEKEDRFNVKNTGEFIELNGSYRKKSSYASINNQGRSSPWDKLMNKTPSNIRNSFVKINYNKKEEESKVTSRVIQPSKQNNFFTSHRKIFNKDDIYDNSKVRSKSHTILSDLIKKSNLIHDINTSKKKLFFNKSQSKLTFDGTIYGECDKVYNKTRKPNYDYFNKHAGLSTNRKTIIEKNSIENRIFNDKTSNMKTLIENQVEAQKKRFQTSQVGDCLNFSKMRKQLSNMSKISMVSKDRVTFKSLVNK